MHSTTHQAIATVWRLESAKLIAVTARMVCDVGLAEELAQDALVAALKTWPAQGIPDNPGAWLMAAAKNRAKIRKEKNQPYTGISTGNSVADKQIYDQTYTSINKYFDQAVKKVLDVQRFSFNIPASPASAEFATAWNDAINRVLAGQQSPKEALDQAQKEAVAAIKKATR